MDTYYLKNLIFDLTILEYEMFMNSLEVFPRVAGENIIKTHTDATIYNIEEVFIENKFIGLFSLLFGISMGIFMDNARRKKNILQF